MDNGRESAVAWLKENVPAPPRMEHGQPADMQGALSWNLPQSDGLTVVENILRKDRTSFTHVRPASSPNPGYRTFYTGGFSRFVTSTAAPVATGRSENCRAGFAPAEKHRLGTAHLIDLLGLYPAICDHVVRVACFFSSYFLARTLTTSGLFKSDSIDFLKIFGTSVLAISTEPAHMLPGTFTSSLAWAVANMVQSLAITFKIKS